jgi:hypothetical protein
MVAWRKRRPNAELAIAALPNEAAEPRVLSITSKSNEHTWGKADINGRQSDVCF